MINLNFETMLSELCKYYEEIVTYHLNDHKDTILTDSVVGEM